MAFEEEVKSQKLKVKMAVRCSEAIFLFVIFYLAAIAKLQSYQQPPISNF